jgi:hypothetical protein
MQPLAQDPTQYVAQALHSPRLPMRAPILFPTPALPVVARSLHVGGGVPLVSVRSPHGGVRPQDRRGAHQGVREAGGGIQVIPRGQVQANRDLETNQRKRFTPHGNSLEGHSHQETVRGPSVYSEGWIAHVQHTINQHGASGGHQ